MAYLIAKYKIYNTKKDKKRYQSKTAVKKTQPGSGDIEGKHHSINECVGMSNATRYLLICLSAMVYLFGTSHRL